MPKRPTPKSSRYVSTFGPGMPAGIADSKEILGGKGAGLARMSAIGLPVPPGLTITTEACNAYSRSGKFPAGLVQEIERAVVQLGKAMGKTFGDPAEPLLVSVRSGARASMPGMMDTFLNLGLNENTVAGLAAASGDERFAWDSYRRFVFMYSDVVLGLSEDECPFEAIFAAAKKRLKVKNDTEVGAGDLKKVVRESLALVRKRTGQPFPTNPWEQPECSRGGSSAAGADGGEAESARPYNPAAAWPSVSCPGDRPPGSWPSPAAPLPTPRSTSRPSSPATPRPATTTPRPRAVYCATRRRTAAARGR
jgi:hypothetical protein